MSKSLGTEFPKQQERVRELLQDYLELPAISGAFGVAMLKAVLHRADEAAISGDVFAMMQSFEEMRGCK